MNAAGTLAQTISEPMTWAEICSRYPGQWVCLVDIGRSQLHNFPFRTARVVGHGKTRREPLDQARRWRDRYRSIGHYFTGPIIAPVPRFFA